jgi:hypothetical protein
MSALVLGAGVPFLGAIVFGWLALIVGVMAFYLLLVYRQGQSHGEEYVPEWRRSEPATSRPRNEPLAPAWVQPSRVSVQVQQSRPAVPDPRLPAYDMENFPEDHWGTAQLN